MYNYFRGIPPRAAEIFGNAATPLYRRGLGARRSEKLSKEGLIKMLDKTMTFSVHEDRENEMKEILTTVYDALKQKGYNPINQLVGYILSEDPTYITTFNNARGLIRHIDRDELLQVLVRSYLSN